MNSFNNTLKKREFRYNFVRFKTITFSPHAVDGAAAEPPARGASRAERALLVLWQSVVGRHMLVRLGRSRAMVLVLVSVGLCKAE